MLRFSGNFRVGEILTGEIGRHIHSFFPNIFSKLGGLGLLIMISIVIITGCRQILDLHAGSTSGSSYKEKAQSDLSYSGFYTSYFSQIFRQMSLGLYSGSRSDLWGKQ